MAAEPLSRSILIVEDNKKLASFLLRALSEEGYVVDLVEDGAVAIAQSRGISYDLVILDWMLPSVDGLTVCRTLRSAMPPPCRRRTRATSWYTRSTSPGKASTGAASFFSALPCKASS